MNYSKLLIFKHKCQNYWRIYWERKSNYGYFFLNLVFLISAWYLAYFIFFQLINIKFLKAFDNKANKNHIFCNFMDQSFFNKT